MIDWFNFATLVLLYFWLVFSPVDERRKSALIGIGAVLIVLGLVLRVWIRAGHG